MALALADEIQAELHHGANPMDLQSTIKAVSAIASVWTWIAFKRSTKREEAARKLRERLDAAIKGHHARI
jgi:hypothetical protein